MLCALSVRTVLKQLLQWQKRNKLYVSCGFKLWYIDTDKKDFCFVFEFTINI